MWRCQPLGMRRSACHHPWPAANRAAERVAHLPAGARGLVWLTPALRTCDYQKLPSDYLKRWLSRVSRAGPACLAPRIPRPGGQDVAARWPVLLLAGRGLPRSGKQNTPFRQAEHPVPAGRIPRSGSGGTAFWQAERRDGWLMGPCGLAAGQEVLAPRREVSAPRGRRCPGGVCCPRADVPGRPGLFPRVTGSTPAMSYRSTAVRSDLR
jgi:hypothetical protein